MAMNASSRGWLLPAGLIGLAVVPLAAGSMRLVELAGDVTITADNARFHAAPWPVVVHIASAALFCVMGAFQFASRQVQRHRKAGLVALPAGLLVALTGLLGRPDEDSRAVLMGAGWVINVVVAEALVARRRKPAAGGLPAQQA
jgi:hypothetical protein